MDKIMFNESTKLFKSSDCVDWCVREYQNFIINEELRAIIWVVVGLFIIVLPELLKLLTNFDFEDKDLIFKLISYENYVRVFGIFIILYYIYLTVY